MSEAPGAPGIRVVAWSGVIVASAFPQIIAREVLGGTDWWLPVAQFVLLAAAGGGALASRKFQPIGRFLLALGALRLGWYFLGPRLGAIPIIHGWLEDANWRVRLFVARSLPIGGAVLMLFTLIGAGIGRRELFLRVGDLAAIARPVPFLGFTKPVRWTVFGPALLLIFGIALPLFLYFTVHPNFNASARIWHFMPWILAIAALNAANEEFQFRNVLLAHLRDAVAPGEAALLTAVLFGSGHYYGQPSGPIGVVMAGFAGWIWAKSMIETRGSGWAFSIHMVQDVVIFSFLAMSGVK